MNYILNFQFQAILSAFIFQPYVAQGQIFKSTVKNFGKSCSLIRVKKNFRDHPNVYGLETASSDLGGRI